MLRKWNGSKRFGIAPPSPTYPRRPTNSTTRYAVFSMCLLSVSRRLSGTRLGFDGVYAFHSRTLWEILVLPVSNWTRNTCRGGETHAWELLREGPAPRRTRHFRPWLWCVQFKFPWVMISELISTWVTKAGEACRYSLQRCAINFNLIPWFIDELPDRNILIHGLWAYRILQRKSSILMLQLRQKDSRMWRCIFKEWKSPLILLIHCYTR